MFLASLFTLCNALKPLLVDDAAYYYFARHIAQDPQRPYHFEMFWYQRPQPANNVLAPPVLPYWWSLAYRLFGEQPWLWKLWLFPFACLLVFALDSLYRRFAPGLERQLVWFTVLSPSLLPSFNLMLDVPALALGLMALVVFFRAVDKQALLGAVGAGFLAGLAMQTKYTAFMIPAVMALYGLMFARTWKRAAVVLLAVGLAVGLFASWEGLMVWQEKKSHLQANMPTYHDMETWWWESKLWREHKQGLARAVLPMLGGLAPALTLLGLNALHVPRSITIGLTICLGLGFLGVALFDIEPYKVSDQFWLRRPLEQIFFGISGILLTVTVFAVGLELCWPKHHTAAPSGAGARFAPAWSWFLLLWLGGELASYFVLSTFPAARRVMGLVLLATLLVGRLCAQTCRLPRRRSVMHGALMVGIVLGFVFYTVDLVDAWTGRNAAVAAGQAVGQLQRQEEQPGQVWYVGHWGFQYYAEQAGMKPVVPDSSLLRPGDWLVVPSTPPKSRNHIEKQSIVLDEEYLYQAKSIRIARTLPLRTVMCYYGGFVPIEHQAGPRLEVVIYRVTRGFFAQTPR